MYMYIGSYDNHIMYKLERRDIMAVLGHERRKEEEREREREEREGGG